MKSWKICTHPKYLYIPVSLFFILILLSSDAFARDDREMQVLQMYFSRDELVITPTRAPKPVSEVAENISVVTAEDIRNMNAHTLDEVLESITGVFVLSFGNDFGSTSIVDIQGSDARHVLVLLDGVNWNTLTDGSSSSNTVPVGIIKRIEVIKGPASSSWGSSLGGVINIITKDAGSMTGAGGSFEASYGMAASQDYRGEVSGAAGKTDYYLYAGRQYSDGLRNERSFEDNAFYAKIDMHPYQGAGLMVTAGFSEPHNNYGDLPDYDLTSTGDNRAFFTTLSFMSEISDELSLDASMYFYKNRFTQDNRFLSNGTLYKKLDYDEKSFAGSAKVVYAHQRHTAVVGMDAGRGELAQTVDYYKAPLLTETNEGVSRWAVFTNDTISLGRVTVTPGIRYDYNDSAGGFTSPSIGATCLVREHTILKLSVARGFNVPPLSYVSGGGFKLDPNPSLGPETVWSYQAGVESSALTHISARMNVFRHDLENALIKDTVAGHANRMYLNKGGVRRDGIDVGIETAPYYNTSVKAGYVYVHEKKNYEDMIVETHAADIALKYDDVKSFLAMISGRYMYWDSDETDTSGSGILMDLDLRKKIGKVKKINSELFISVHNLFNGVYYSTAAYPNPDRWAEAGVRLEF